MQRILGKRSLSGLRLPLKHLDAGTQLGHLRRDYIVVELVGGVGVSRSHPRFQPLSCQLQVDDRLSRVDQLLRSSHVEVSLVLESVDANLASQHWWQLQVSTIHYL